MTIDVWATEAPGIATQLAARWVSAGHDLSSFVLFLRLGSVNLAENSRALFQARTTATAQVIVEMVKAFTAAEDSLPYKLGIYCSRNLAARVSQWTMIAKDEFQHHICESEMEIDCVTLLGNEVVEWNHKNTTENSYWCILALEKCWFFPYSHMLGNSVHRRECGERFKAAHVAVTWLEPVISLSGCARKVFFLFRWWRTGRVLSFGRSWWLNFPLMCIH